MKGTNNTVADDTSQIGQVLPNFVKNKQMTVIDINGLHICFYT